MATKAKSATKRPGEDPGVDRLRSLGLGSLGAEAGKLAHELRGAQAALSDAWEGVMALEGVSLKSPHFLALDGQMFIVQSRVLTGIIDDLTKIAGALEAAART
jgi:hypothetical protein